MLTSTHLFHEISEQPRVLEALLAEGAEGARALAKAVRERDIAYVVIAARGTSDNAALYAKYVLGSMNRLPVALAAPSLFTLYKRPPQFRNALVLGISQSGRSPDIVAVVAEARRQGALTAVITNFETSDLAAQGEFVLPLRAGEEHAVAATKTYTAELAAVALFSAALAGDAAMGEALRLVPQAVSRALALEDKVAQLALRYRSMTHAVVVGRGYNYATAFEMALKLKELTYATVQPYSSADFLHGPLAMVAPGFPTFVIAAAGDLVEEMRKFIRVLTGQQADVLCISDDETILQSAALALPVGRLVPEWLSPIPLIVPGQLLSMHLAHLRNHDVDSPRGLKKVTETH